MPRTIPFVARALATSLAVALVACSSNAATEATDAKAEVAADVSQEWTQGYSATLTFHGGPADPTGKGATLQLDRDLTSGASTVFAFGSTHLQWPAISLSMTDNVYEINGKQTTLEFHLGLGLLVGSGSGPNGGPPEVHTPAVGTYPFSCKPPLLRVVYKGFQYKSTCPDLNGEIQVTQWSKTAGGRMVGTFSGTLHFYFADPSHQDDCSTADTVKPGAVADTAITCPVTKPWSVDVQGHFGFTLPPPDGGAG
jgi:hypothetical protein